MASEPSRSVEIELKFDVDADTPLPDWTGMPGVASVAAPEVRELDARYLDSDDAALARAGYALRRRTGGPDEGWHIKGPRGADGGRVELHWPLQDGIPDAATAVLSSVTAAPLTPLARIRNHRTAYHLLDAAGGVVAEFVDDHVTATDARSGVERTWREWELELGAAAPADPASFFAAAEVVVHATGARPAASDSKLAKALGH
ncbi:CYTH domain-containing protein [Microbacterium sp. SS28]|uniref:CYTH domain-containing protein n=1 Tax=Microbacterium sp. SS28 TaxID=2919948 RepID=UPI001FAA9A3A|nr:CYTH domain-containing protein [Microbacterium sp. SS28]